MYFFSALITLCKLYVLLMWASSIFSWYYCSLIFGLNNTRGTVQFKRIILNKIDLKGHPLDAFPSVNQPSCANGSSINGIPFWSNTFEKIASKMRWKAKRVDISTTFRPYNSFEDPQHLGVPRYSDVYSSSVLLHFVRVTELSYRIPFQPL